MVAFNNHTLVPDNASKNTAQESPVLKPNQSTRLLGLKSEPSGNSTSSDVDNFAESENSSESIYFAFPADIQMGEPYIAAPFRATAADQWMSGSSAFVGYNFATETQDQLVQDFLTSHLNDRVQIVGGGDYIDIGTKEELNEYFENILKPTIEQLTLEQKLRMLYGAAQFIIGNHDIIHCGTIAENTILSGILAVALGYTNAFDGSIAEYRDHVIHPETNGHENLINKAYTIDAIKRMLGLEHLLPTCVHDFNDECVVFEDSEDLETTPANTIPTQTTLDWHNPAQAEAIFNYAWQPASTAENPQAWYADLEIADQDSTEASRIFLTAYTRDDLITEEQPVFFLHIDFMDFTGRLDLLGSQQLRVSQLQIELWHNFINQMREKYPHAQFVACGHYALSTSALNVGRGDNKHLPENLAGLMRECITYIGFHEHFPDYRKIDLGDGHYIPQIIGPSIRDNPSGMLTMELGHDDQGNRILDFSVLEAKIEDHPHYTDAVQTQLDSLLPVANHLPRAANRITDPLIIQIRSSGESSAEFKAGLANLFDFKVGLVATELGMARHLHVHDVIPTTYAQFESYFHITSRALMLHALENKQTWASEWQNTVNEWLDLVTRFLDAIHHPETQNLDTASLITELETCLSKAQSLIDFENLDQENPIRKFFADFHTAANAFCERLPLYARLYLEEAPHLMFRDRERVVDEFINPLLNFRSEPSYRELTQELRQVDIDSETHAFLVGTHLLSSELYVHYYRQTVNEHGSDGIRVGPFPRDEEGNYSATITIHPDGHTTYTEPQPLIGRKEHVANSLDEIINDPAYRDLPTEDDIPHLPDQTATISPFEPHIGFGWQRGERVFVETGAGISYLNALTPVGVGRTFTGSLSAEVGVQLGMVLPNTARHRPAGFDATVFAQLGLGMNLVFNFASLEINARIQAPLIRGEFLSSESIQRQTEACIGVRVGIEGLGIAVNPRTCWQLPQTGVYEGPVRAAGGVTFEVIPGAFLRASRRAAQRQ